MQDHAADSFRSIEPDFEREARQVEIAVADRSIAGVKRQGDRPACGAARLLEIDERVVALACGRQDRLGPFGACVHGRFQQQQQPEGVILGERVDLPKLPLSRFADVLVPWCVELPERAGAVDASLRLEIDTAIRSRQR